eukprot:TRINITY_DN35998_c0_g1_i11.p2 TRINITY_DN35998_c0_g1~~TRINITY_DN35998_c0_g1_i11.p2  ORF type:complete len:352 (+),score=38.25 TRINITY_DN35998_c0_g1_i11:86-1141(+)
MAKMYENNYKFFILLGLLCGQQSYQQEEDTAPEQQSIFEILQDAGYATFQFDESDFIIGSSDNDKEDPFSFIDYQDDQLEVYNEKLENFTRFVGSQEFISTLNRSQTLNASIFEQFNHDAKQPLCNSTLQTTLRNQFTSVGVVTSNSQGKISNCAGVLIADNAVVCPGGCVNKTDEKATHIFRSALLNQEFPLLLKKVVEYKESDQSPYIREFALFIFQDDIELDNINRITLDNPPMGNCSLVIVGIDGNALIEGSEEPYKFIPCPKLPFEKAGIDWRDCPPLEERCDLNDLGILSGAAITIACERQGGEVYLLGLQANISIDDQTSGLVPFMFGNDIYHLWESVQNLRSG